jgi:hypothetical protein
MYIRNLFHQITTRNCTNVRFQPSRNVDSDNPQINSKHTTLLQAYRYDPLSLLTTYASKFCILQWMKNLQKYAKFSSGKMASQKGTGWTTKNQISYIRDSSQASVVPNQSHLHTPLLKNQSNLITITHNLSKSITTAKHTVRHHAYQPKH